MLAAGSTSVTEVTLPAVVAISWANFADHVNIGELQEADYARFTDVALVAHANATGLDALQDSIIDLASRGGAPEYLAGELTMGLDIALRALAAGVASSALPAAAVDKAAQEKAAAETARIAALSKLSDEERKALGLQ